MRFVWACCLLAGIFLVGPVAAAQGAPPAAAGRFNATREELDSLAARADGAAAEALRARLRDGDFKVGDRVTVFLRGDSALSDTFAVERGPTLALPNIPTVSLAGVLRSELQWHLTKQLGEYVRDTALRAKALINFGVVGEVARPGFYLLPIDVPISDAIMAAGGLTTRSELPKTFVRRGSRQLLSKHVVRQAIVDGVTLEHLNLDAGDELVVGAKRDWNWPTVASLATGALALLLSVNAR